MPDDARLIMLPGGIQVPVPRWTTTAFGVIAVVAIAFGAYRYFYPVVPELTTAKQANERLQRELQHYNAHMFETPLDAFAGSAISVRVYEDDCLLVARKNATRLLIASTGSVARSGLLPVVHAEEAQGCAHSGGQFTVQNGNRVDACWVEVWRTFTDGCRHVQLMNTCNGSFQSNSDGSPRVRWTRCNH
jgi:hypothetical protein